MRRFILLMALVFPFFSSYSQNFDIKTWQHIDTCVVKKKNLSEVSVLIQVLKQRAFSEKKYFHLARCYYYQILIADQKTEDSLYFLNSAFLDSIISGSVKSTELQMAAHLLQAKRLSVFTTRNNRFNRQKYERKDILVNYAVYTNNQLDSIAQLHFEEAKKIAKNLSVQEIDDVLWISADPLLFLFKPGLFDIIIADQICEKKILLFFSTGDPANAIYGVVAGSFY
jgi:alpha-2-macroglobulin